MSPFIQVVKSKEPSLTSHRLKGKIMSTFTEVTYISEFNIQPNGCIGIRKTTDILKDGVVISSTSDAQSLCPMTRRHPRCWMRLTT